MPCAGQSGLLKELIENLIGKLAILVIIIPFHREREGQFCLFEMRKFIKNVSVCTGRNLRTIDAAGQ